MGDSAGKAYGLIAEFDTAADILHAARTVREASFTRWDVFTPFPVHGMDGAMGIRNSLVGWFSFLGGATGYACTIRCSSTGALPKPPMTSSSL